MQTTSSNLGIVFLCFSAMTNGELELDKINSQKPLKNPFEQSEVVLVENLPDDISLNIDHDSDEEVILRFAQNLINSSYSLESDYQKIIQKRFWDLI